MVWGKWMSPPSPANSARWERGGCQADPHPHASGAATLASGTAFLPELVHLQMGVEKKPNRLSLYYKREYMCIYIKSPNKTLKCQSRPQQGKPESRQRAPGTVCGSHGGKERPESPACAAGHQAWALGQAHSPWFLGPNPVL